MSQGKDDLSFGFPQWEIRSDVELIKSVERALMVSMMLAMIFVGATYPPIQSEIERYSVEFTIFLVSVTAGFGITANEMSDVAKDVSITDEIKQEVALYRVCSLILTGSMILYAGVYTEILGSVQTGWFLAAALSTTIAANRFMVRFLGQFSTKKSIFSSVLWVALTLTFAWSLNWV